VTKKESISHFVISESETNMIDNDIKELSNQIIALKNAINELTTVIRTLKK
jgi:prefoldin subunit 5